VSYCARREEKERLSQLYEDERLRNLENENKIRSVMQVRYLDNALWRTGCESFVGRSCREDG
jgi:hypothetical protein